MNIVIYLLTAVLILDSLFLGLLILVQLPKKEAGIGMAFGGGAADALFGAGSGTALSSLTKYSAIVFFVLVFSLSVLNNNASHPNSSALKKAMQAQAAQTPAPTPNAAPAATPLAVPSAIPAVPMAVSNTAAPRATNAAPTPK